MSRLLFLVAAATVVYLLLKSYRARLSGEEPSGGAEQPRRAEDMVRCVHCGVHLPKSESILAGDNYYCSEAHRLAHRPPTADRDEG